MMTWIEESRIIGFMNVVGPVECTCLFFAAFVVFGMDLLLSAVAADDRSLDSCGKFKWYWCVRNCLGSVSLMPMRLKNRSILRRA